MKSTMRIDTYGNKVWKNENDQLHREDGPAFEYAHGSKFWYVNGRCHREDGPAVEYANGSKSWFINNNPLTEQEFNNYVNRKSINNEKIVYIVVRTITKPTIIELKQIVEQKVGYVRKILVDAKNIQYCWDFDDDGPFDTREEAEAHIKKSIISLISDKLDDIKNLTESVAELNKILSEQIFKNI